MSNMRTLPLQHETEAFTRHRGPVTCVVGIPGRAAAITAGYDAAIAYVDLERRTIELMGYHEHLANAVSIDATGTRAASSSSDYTICIWDLDSRRPQQILRGHHDDVNGFAFVDAHTGASVSHDHRVYVWNLDTGAVRAVLEGHLKYAMSIDAADGLIYSSGDDMTLRQWDARTGAQLQCWGPFEVEADSCAIDARRNRVVLGADDGVIRIFDAHSGQAIGHIQAHDSGIKKIAVSSVSGAILSAAYDQRLRVWNANTFALEAELDGATNVWERSLNWSPDGQSILGGTFDGTVLIWSIADPQAPPVEIGRDGAAGNQCINDVSAADDGQLAFVSDDGLVRLAQLAPGRAECFAELEPPGGRVLMNAVTLDVERDRVLAGTHDQRLLSFERGRGQGFAPRLSVPLGEGPINCVRVARHPGYQGDAFVACYSGTVVRVSPTGELLHRARLHDGAVKALRLHPSRPLAVSCSADGELLSWDLDGRVRARFRGHVAIADDVDLDPEGLRVGTVSRDFTLKVYELDSERLLFSRFLGQKSPKSMCFWSRDVVVVGNYWGWLLRFELDTGEVRRARIASNGISSLSRAGRWLAAASYDGAIYLVDPDRLEIVETLRMMVQRVTNETIFG